MSLMYKILCKFAGEDRLVDVFNDCDNLEAAKHFADRWKQGIFTHDADAIYALSSRKNTALHG